MKIGSASRAITRVRWRVPASWALITALASACAKFSGTEPPSDAGPSAAADSAADAVAPNDVAAGDAGADAPPQATLCPDGSHTFCDDFDTGELFDSRWTTVTGREHFSFSSSNTVSQPRALRIAGQRINPNALARAEARLPTPSRTIQCQAQVRIQTANAEGSLPLALRFAGPTGHLLVLVFFFPGAFELGVERSVSNASPTYTNVYKTQPIPQIGSVTKTTLEVSAVNKRARLTFADATVASLDLDFPTDITSTTFSIGDLRVNGSTGVAVETFFDDVSCDVDLP